MTTPIQELEQLLAKATPGNMWNGDGFEVCSICDEDERPTAPNRHVSVEGVGSVSIAWFHNEHDAKLWAAAVNSLPALIASYRTMEGALEPFAKIKPPEKHRCFLQVLMCGDEWRWAI